MWLSLFVALDPAAIADHRWDMRITPLLVAIAVIFAIGAGASTQRRGGGGSATLAISVTDPAGTPVSNALVTLQGAAARSARTERGRIAFEKLPAGVYRLRFESDAFITLERDIVARGSAPIDVKVTMTPAPPVKPVPCVETRAPAPPAPAPPVATPMAIDVPDFIEKNHVGRDPSKISAITCTPGGSASLIQVREPMPEQTHADADEFIYVIAGTGSVRIGDRAEPLQSGVLALVPRTMPHVITARGRGPLYVLSIRAGEKCGAAQK
jgi:mannose-6-phosphate isomerase-like protein (cupin superfamily)